MRKYLALATVLALTACGGGGGGNTPVPGGGGGGQPTIAPSTAPSSTPTAAPSSKYATPTFYITIPKRAAAKKNGKTPLDISSSVESIKITLNTVNGNPPGSITGNPAVANKNSSNCGSGCTLTGPPSPFGSDSFTLTTYDQQNGVGNQLDIATQTFTIVQGTNNAETVTLQGIPVTITVTGVPAPGVDASTSTAVGGPSSGGIAVSELDADGNAITGTYMEPVTLADPDATQYGSYLTTGTCPATKTGYSSPTAAATSLTFTSDSSAGNFCYGGIGENPQTLTGSATGAYTVTSGTASFQPVLAVPVELSGSATPTGVATDGGGIALFATTGLGSTGSITYTEAGWTDAPYGQALDAFANLACAPPGGSFSNYATVAGAANGTSGTVFTVTAVGSPTAGACPLTISDALLSNTTDSNGLGDGVPLVELDTSYTSSSFSVNGKTRKH
ncbi:MAG TPA: hypothetical protein VMD91_03380 [Candidatus Sulfotelmatobacter sp.]|nr:hypothetical protein [Candidatus Sulfotelmatobacter sp.]